MKTVIPGVMAVIYSFGNHQEFSTHFSVKCYRLSVMFTDWSGKAVGVFHWSVARE